MLADESNRERLLSFRQVVRVHAVSVDDIEWLWDSSNDLLESSVPAEREIGWQARFNA